jgi:hypothetical protein
MAVEYDPSKVDSSKYQEKTFKILERDRDIQANEIGQMKNRLNKLEFLYNRNVTVDRILDYIYAISGAL